MAKRKRFSSIPAWILSFFSPSLYRDVGTNWRGIGLFYLLFLLAVCWIPLMYKNYDNIVQMANGLVPVIEQIPSMQIKDGHFSIDEQMPYQVKFGDTDRTFIMIDTTGGTVADTLESGSVLINDTKVVTKSPSGDVQTIAIPEMLNIKFDPAMVKSLTPNLSYWAIGISYVFVLLGSWLYRILVMFIYAAIGGIFFFDLVRHSLNYKGLLRITAVAMTPAIILCTVQTYVGYAFPYQGLAYFGVSMFYLCVGILSNKTKTLSSAQSKKSSEQVDLNP